MEQTTQTTVQPSEKPMKISITLPTNAYFVSGIRDFTMQMVKNMTEFSEQWAFRFQAVVDELCNNAIEHGSKEGEDVYVSFSCIKGKTLEITVDDTGTGPSQLSPEELKNLVETKKNVPPTQITSLRGRGLPHIVANWSDELHFSKSEKGGIQAKIIKHIDKQ